MSIVENNNIVYVNHRRFYSLDLTQEYNNLENSIPKLFKYKDIKISSNSWGDMAVQIVEELNKINPKTTEELLSVQYPFSDKYEVFSKEKKTNYSACLGVYLCTNHGANRALSAIKTLITFYGVDLKDVYFLLNRHPGAESKECRDYFRAITIDHMKTYFVEVKNYNLNKTNAIIENLKELNKTLAKLSKSYDDFFLFDTDQAYYQYAEIVRDYIEKHRQSQEQYNITKKTLEFGLGYYKWRRKNPLY